MDIRTLCKELVYFGNRYKVNVVDPIVDNINHIIDNKLYKKNLQCTILCRVVL